MTGSPIYPISCLDIPEPLYRLLSDLGVPVRKCERGHAHSQILIHDLQHSTPDQSTVDSNCNKIPPLRISWQSLLNGLAVPGELDPRLQKTVACRWLENGIPVSENIIDDSVIRKIESRLRHMIITHGLPWVQFAPYPSGYCGVFNFRIDIDEPEPLDWHPVISALEPVEPAVTWFLSTIATEKCPQIYDWLKGCDVQSHGHWHHVHRNDPDLNRLNLHLAHHALLDRGFAPIGYAAPCGRMTNDLPGHLSALSYQYLAGIGDLCGSIPRSCADGIWRIQALPVSEGLFLEAGVDHSDSIIEAYLAIAQRAISNNRPMFWYGHAERRLGRRPQILKELVSHVLQRRGLWHVQIGSYLKWLKGRSEMQCNIFQSPDAAGALKLRWNNPDFALKPQILINDSQYQWQVEIDAGQGEMDFQMTPETAIEIPNRLDPPVNGPLEPFWSWKSAWKQAIDWERQTPVDKLQTGPLVRRLKGFLRSQTDEKWQSRFVPKAWPVDVEMDRKTA